MQGCPRNVWASILSHEKLASERLFGYLPSACSLTVLPQSVSWVLQWVLMHFSAKHRFLSTKSVNLDWVASDSWNAMQRLLRRVHCAANQQQPSPFVKACSPQTLQQFMPMQGTLAHRWMVHFRRVLLNTTFSHASRLAHNSSNMFGLVRLGLLELKQTDLICVPLDKEPGYVLVSPQDFALMEQLAVPEKYYLPWPISLCNFASICDEYSKLAGDIGFFHEDPRVASNIRSSVASGCFVCPLTILVKSHKPVGSQGLRTIHCGYNPSFSGLSRWLVKTLEPFMLAVPWCYRDSFAVRDAILSTRVFPSTRVVKIDLKDFSCQVSTTKSLHRFRA